MLVSVRQRTRRMSAQGSNSEVGLHNRHVRFPPVSDRIADIAGGSGCCQILTSYPCTRSVASSYTLANGVAFFGCIFCLR
jgi:hypothetical protein